MKRITQFIIVAAVCLALFACSSSRFIPEQKQQAVLRSWKYVGNKMYHLALTVGNDTVRARVGYNAKVRFKAGTIYTIRYDSTQYRIIDGHKYYRCIIRKNF